ncbi:MAG: STM3941 family protein [Brachybacterium tyrofermentans]|uniref:STM3941 family protein n=1 Tax=Brachybacterium tyrofermentans TaxID=47848 RepID=A0ABW0FEI0_9MICO|nr:STM3941 family protein [Brachybacterium tyrofermentans]SLN00517.1 hypothetical protein FM103_08240 [Corynebacterium xerosis]
MSTPTKNVAAWTSTLAQGEPVTFRFSRVRGALLALLCVFLILVGLVLGLAASGVLMLLGWLVVLGCLVLMVVHLRRAISPAVGLTVAPTGLTMTTARAGEIPWSEILQVETITQDSNRQIELGVTNAEAQRQYDAGLVTVFDREKTDGRMQKALWLPAGLAASKPALTSWIDEELTARSRF